MMYMRSSVKPIAMFIVIEFLLVGSFLVIAGGFGFEPLPITDAIAESFVGDTTITPVDMAIGLFIGGTFVNLIMLFWSLWR